MKSEGINFEKEIAGFGKNEEAIIQGITSLRNALNDLERKDRLGESDSVRDDHGETLLRSALLANCVDVLEFLLNENVEEIDATNKYGESLLHLIATKPEHIEIAKKLLDRGADFALQDNNGLTPFYFAAQSGNKVLVEHIMAAYEGKDKNKEDIIDIGDSMRSETPLQAVIRSYLDRKNKDNSQDYLETIKILLENNANINAKDYRGKSPLHSAVEANDASLFELLSPRINIDENIDKHLLHLAAKVGNLKAVKELINKGAQINIQDDEGVTPLYLAAANGHLDVVKFLWEEAKADSLLGDYFLFGAFKYKKDEVAEYIINKMNEEEAKKPYNERTRIARTPLFAAVKYGVLSSLELLVENKNVDIFEKQDEYSLLHLAARYGHKNVAEYLIKKGMDINKYAMVEGEGFTPLHQAIYSKDFETVKLLLESGAELKRTQNRGQTPLGVAMNANAFANPLKSLLILWELRSACKEDPIDYQLERTLNADLDPMSAVNAQAKLLDKIDMKLVELVKQLHAANKDPIRMKEIIDDGKNKNIIGKDKYDFIVQYILTEKTLEEAKEQQASVSKESSSQSASRMRFFKGNSIPMSAPSPDELKKMLDQDGHATNRDGLKLKLQKYIARIESHQQDEKRISDIKFNYGFSIFTNIIGITRESRAKNREANYNLARDLLGELLKEEKSIKDIFNDDNIKTLKEQYPRTRSFKNSAELYGIIEDGQKLAETEIRLEKK